MGLHECIKEKESNGYKYTICHICKDDLKYPDSWREIHIKLMHEDDKMIMCDKCGDIIGKILK